MLSLSQTLDDRRLIRVLVAPVGNNSLFSKQFQIVSTLREIPLYELNRPANAKGCPFKAMNTLQGRLLFEYLRYDRSSLGPGDLDDFQSSKRICLVMGLINYPELVTNVTSLQEEIDHFLRRYQHIVCKRFFVFNYNFDETIPPSISTSGGNEKSKSINLMEFFHQHKPEYVASTVIFPPEGDLDSGHSRTLIHCQEIMSHASLQIVMQFEKQMWLCEEYLKRNQLPLYNMTLPGYNASGSSSSSTTSSFFQSMGMGGSSSSFYSSHSSANVFVNTELNLVTIYDEKEDIIISPTQLATSSISTNAAQQHHHHVNNGSTGSGNRKGGYTATSHSLGSVKDKEKDHLSKGYKKRPAGRIHKWMADLSMQVCSPIDAIEHYVIAIQECRYLHDYLWLANALDGYSSALLLLNAMQYYPLEDYIGRDLKTVTLPADKRRRATTAGNLDEEEEEEEDYYEEVDEGNGDNEDGTNPSNTPPPSSVQEQKNLEKLYLLIEERCSEALQIYSSHMIFRLLEVECTVRLAKYLMTATVYASSYQYHHFGGCMKQSDRDHKVLDYILRAILHIPGLNTQQQLECILEGALLCQTLHLPRKYILFVYMAAMMAMEGGNYEIAQALFSDLCTNLEGLQSAPPSSHPGGYDGNGGKSPVLWSKLLESIYIQGIILAQDHAANTSAISLQYVLGLFHLILHAQQAASGTDIPHYLTYTPKLLGLDKSMPYLLSMPTGSPPPATNKGTTGSKGAKNIESKTTASGVTTKSRTLSGIISPAQMSLTEDSLRQVSLQDTTSNSATDQNNAIRTVSKTKSVQSSNMVATLPPRVQNPANHLKTRSVTSDFTGMAFSPNAVMSGAAVQSSLSSTKTTGHIPSSAARLSQDDSTISTSRSLSSSSAVGGNSSTKRPGTTSTLSNTPLIAALISPDGGRVDNSFRSPSRDGHSTLNVNVSLVSSAAGRGSNFPQVGFTTPTKQRGSSTSTALAGFAAVATVAATTVSNGVANGIGAAVAASTAGSVTGSISDRMLRTFGIEANTAQPNAVQLASSMGSNGALHTQPHLNPAAVFTNTSATVSKPSVLNPGSQEIVNLLDHLCHVALFSANSNNANTTVSVIDMVATEMMSNSNNIVALDDGSGMIHLYHVVDIDYIKDMLSYITKHYGLPYPSEQEETLIQLFYTLTKQLQASERATGKNGATDKQISENKMKISKGLPSYILPSIPIICHSIQPIVYPSSDCYQPYIMLGNSAQFMQTMRTQFLKALSSGDKADTSADASTDTTTNDEAKDTTKSSAFYFDPFSKKRMNQKSSETAFQQLADVNTLWSKGMIYHLVVLWENPLTVPMRIHDVFPMLEFILPSEQDNATENKENAFDNDNLVARSSEKQSSPNDPFIVVYPQDILIPPQCTQFAVFLPVRINRVGKLKVKGIRGHIGHFTQDFLVDEQGFVLSPMKLINQNSDDGAAEQKFAQEKSHLDVHYKHKRVAKKKKYSYGIPQNEISVRNIPIHTQCYCSWDATVFLTDTCITRLPVSNTVVSITGEIGKDGKNSSSKSKEKSGNNTLPSDLVTPLKTKLALLPGETRCESLYFPYQCIQERNSKDGKIDYRIVVIEHTTAISATSQTPLVSKKQYVAIDYNYLPNTISGGETTSDDQQSLPKNKKAVGGKCIKECEVIEHDTYIQVQLTYSYPTSALPPSSTSRTSASSSSVQYVSQIELILEIVHLDEVTSKMLELCKNMADSATIASELKLSQRRELFSSASSMLLMENEWNIVGRKLSISIDLQYPESLFVYTAPTLLQPACPPLCTEFASTDSTISVDVIPETLNLQFLIQNDTHKTIHFSSSLDKLLSQQKDTEVETTKLFSWNELTQSNSPKIIFGSIPFNHSQHSIVLTYPAVKSVSVNNELLPLYWCFEDDEADCHYPASIELLASHQATIAQKRNNKKCRWGKLFYQTFPMNTSKPVVPVPIVNNTNKEKDRCVDINLSGDSYILKLLSLHYPVFNLSLKVFSNSEEIMQRSKDQEWHKIPILSTITLRTLIQLSEPIKKKDSILGFDVHVVIHNLTTRSCSSHTFIASETAGAPHRLLLTSKKANIEAEFDEVSQQIGSDENKNKDMDGYLVTGQLQACCLLDSGPLNAIPECIHDVELCFFMGGRFSMTVYAKPRTIENPDSSKWFVNSQSLNIIVQESSLI